MSIRTLPIELQTMIFNTIIQSLNANINPLRIVDNLANVGLIGLDEPTRIMLNMHNIVRRRMRPMAEVVIAQPRITTPAQGRISDLILGLIRELSNLTSEGGRFVPSAYIQGAANLIQDLSIWQTVKLPESLRRRISVLSTPIDPIAELDNISTDFAEAIIAGLLEINAHRTRSSIRNISRRSPPTAPPSAKRPRTVRQKKSKR